VNYRHIYHAGNFADVFKHVFLARMLSYLTRKPTPLRYIDTHAGIGAYDLARDEASRTGEWRTGIGRLLTAAVPPAVEPLIAPYRAAVGARDAEGRPARYPGSPAVARALLRPTDRLTLSERHPEDAATLRATMRGDKRVTVLAQDGYRALNALLPPPERRGLVLIDPPFEAPDEHEVLGRALAGARRKWATGVYAIWYPIKDPALAAGHRQNLMALAPDRHGWLEILRDGQAGPALRGCGLFVINPPFGLMDEAAVLLPFLCEALSDPALPPFQGRRHLQDGPP
jgi:23S rRNA (adenine2030-N6)-methyltransferase